jgi:hypothetical protein
VKCQDEYPGAFRNSEDLEAHLLCDSAVRFLPVRRQEDGTSKVLFRRDSACTRPIDTRYHPIGSLEKNGGP